MKKCLWGVMVGKDTKRTERGVTLLGRRGGPESGRFTQCKKAKNQFSCGEEKGESKKKIK